uniref:Uncharacterized protein n=1 Tax=Oryza nivara TaxID=4536 RepID=A0A0E0HGM1_ORYNI
MPSAPSNLACVKDPNIQYLFRFYPPVTVSSSRLVSSRPSNPFPLLLFAAAVLQRLGFSSPPASAPAPRVSSPPASAPAPSPARPPRRTLPVTSVVPSDSVFPEVELAEGDAVVCSRVTPDGGGEVVAWCKIRRGGDVSAATIWNLSLDAIIVDGRVIQQEAVDIKPGSEIVPGPQKDGIENAKCSICLNLWHDVVTVASCLHNFWTTVQLVGGNHFLHNIEERSDEEIALLESYAPVKTNILIKAIYTVRCTTRQRSVPSSASTLPFPAAPQRGTL